MVKAGSTMAADDPVDVTQELPLGDEGELLLEETSFWRRHRGAIIAVAVLVLAGTGGLIDWATSGSSTPAGLVVTNQVVPVTTGTIQQTVATSGTIEPASQANLNFAVSGTVTAVDVKAGQTVTAGRCWPRSARPPSPRRLNAAQAQLSSANARLSSERGLGAATTQIDSDEAAVTSAESSLSTAQTTLGDASLTSTISGTVASVSLTVGQQVSGSARRERERRQLGIRHRVDQRRSSSSAPNSYIVNTTVDDTEIGQIADGDQATIRRPGSRRSTSAPSPPSASSPRRVPTWRPSPWSST